MAAEIKVSSPSFRLQSGDILMKQYVGGATHNIIRSAQKKDKESVKYADIVHAAIVTGVIGNVTLVEAGKKGISSQSAWVNPDGTIGTTHEWDTTNVNRSSDFENIRPNMNEEEKYSWCVFRYKESADELIQECGLNEQIRGIGTVVERLIRSAVDGRRIIYQSPEEFKKSCQQQKAKMDKFGPDNQEQQFWTYVAERINDLPVPKVRELMDALLVWECRALASEISSSFSDANIKFVTDVETFVNSRGAGSYSLGGAVSAALTKRGIRNPTVTNVQIEAILDALGVGRDAPTEAFPKEFYCSQFVVYVYALTSIIMHQGDNQHDVQIPFAINRNITHTTPSQLIKYLLEDKNWTLVNRRSLSPSLLSIIPAPASISPGTAAALSASLTPVLSGPAAAPSSSDTSEKRSKCCINQCVIS